jgi:hypothetical protein
VGSKVFNINHTRLKAETTITSVRVDKYNPMGLIVEFEYTHPVGYFKEDQQISFGLYVDKEFVCEFYDRVIKVQLENLNVVQMVEIYAHPHPGYQFVFERQVPGNKIRLRFRAKDPSKTDIKNHYVYWDNKTGTYLTKKAGIIDPITGQVSGYVFKTGDIIDGFKVFVVLLNDDGVEVVNDDGNTVLVEY